MKKTALIVAGGSGLRMGSLIPKQFLLLQNKPILQHTLEKFYSTGIFDSIIIVLPKSERKNWEKLIAEYKITVPHTIVDGGSSRYESVKNGLRIVESDGLIAIHDGVRPFVTTDLIKRCMNELIQNSNAIPSVSLSDTIRKVDGDSSKIIDRESLKAIQTPQCFHTALLKSAYELSDDGTMTDDAAVFEKAGNKIRLIDGDPSNIKITVPNDLARAEAMLK